MTIHTTIDEQVRRQFAGRRVTVIGLAREGIALARFLAERGAVVTASDAKTAEQLGKEIAPLASLPVRLALGGDQREHIAGAEVVFVSPGVPEDAPPLAAARALGIPISSQIRLFFELCPAPVVGITGSSGKTTTTSLVGEIFRAAGALALVGGNIGLPVIDRLAEITPAHRVVLELSSFQLLLLDCSPHVAAITNITPNHLDRHPTMEHYAEAKRNIVRYQGPGDFAILNADDQGSRASGGLGQGRTLWFSRLAKVEKGACCRDGVLVLRRDGRETPICRRDELRLRGEHNVENVLAAAAVASACDLPIEAIAAVARSFAGVEHRLEPVRTVGDVEFVNDSIATAPERTIAALRAFDRPIVLLAGGRDKHLPLADLAELVHARCRAVVLFGEAAGLLEEALGSGVRGQGLGPPIPTAKTGAGTGAPTTLPPHPLPLRDGPHPLAPSPLGGEGDEGGEVRMKRGKKAEVVRADSFGEAVRLAVGLACPGDVVLLSPAYTSYDQFRDFEERGREFKRIVGELQPDEVGRCA